MVEGVHVWTPMVDGVQVWTHFVNGCRGTGMDTLGSGG